MHIALVTVSESPKVPKSHLYVQTRGRGTLELWDDRPSGASLRPFVPVPCPMRADARERGTKGRKGDETRGNHLALMGWRTLGAMGSRSAIFRGSGW